MKKRYLQLFFISLLAFFSGCGSDEAKTIVEDTKGFKELKVESNKTYTLTTTTGEKIVFTIKDDILTSKQLAGKRVLINFWATWCPPCKKEIPAFNVLHDKYKDSFEILGVLIEKDKDPKELKAYMDELKMNFPVTIGDENFRLAKLFNDVKKVPESYLFDKDGKFMKEYIGEVNQSELESLISK